VPKAHKFLQPFIEKVSMIRVSGLLNKICFSEIQRRYLNLRGIVSRRHAYKGPDIVQLDLTDQCNSNCMICWIHSPVVDKGPFFKSLDFEKVKNFIQDISKLKVRDIIFSGGGEPFCYSKIWETLELAQRHGLSFHINTNFTLLKRSDIKRLCAFDKLSSLTISLWASTPDLYSRVHGRSADTFSDLVENIKFLNCIKHPKLYVKIAAVMNNTNYQNLRGFADLMHKTGCPNLEFGVCDSIAETTQDFMCNKDQLVVLKKNFNDLEQYIKRKRYAINIVNREVFLRRITSPAACCGEYDTRMAKTPCYTGWTFLRLRANGDFNSCLKSHRIPIGNIYKDSINTVWNNALQQQFRENTLSVPKDKEYFQYIGNNDNAEIGCKSVCDNIVQSSRLYNTARFLSQMHKPMI